MGEAEAWLRELRREGMPVPELDEEPALPVSATAVWSAFTTLNDSRAVHFGGPGAIPLTEIEAYCRLHGIDDLEERGSLVRLLRRIDRAYLAQLGKNPERRDA